MIFKLMVYSQLWKVKIFFGNIYLHQNQTLIFEEQLCVSNMDFYIDTDQAKSKDTNAEQPPNKIWATEEEAVQKQTM